MSILRNCKGVMISGVFVGKPYNIEGFCSNSVIIIAKVAHLCKFLFINV
jgi:hypothetical protein